MEDMLKFKGFADRTTWWIAMITVGLAGIMPPALIESIHSGHSTAAVVIIGVLAFVIWAVLAWIQVAVYKARLNQAGWSGWWMLFPVLNIVVAGFFKPKMEDNKYRG